MALDIMKTIHNERFQVIMNTLLPYVPQIDSTEDRAFDMIVVTRDSIPGFTLYPEKCFCESEENIISILNRINERFGIPSGKIR